MDSRDAADYRPSQADEAQGLKADAGGAPMAAGAPTKRKRPRKKRVPVTIQVAPVPPTSFTRAEIDELVRAVRAKRG